MSAELSGFGTQRRSALRFQANTKPILNLTLSVGGVAETVTVVGDQQLLDTGQAMVALRVTTEQIQELPLVGRDVLDLALMGAGVSEVATGAPAGATSQTISGTYSRYTAYQLDGFGNTRDQHGVQKADVSLDAISEFSVLTNQFSAEYGQSMSGIVSVITKSGTNDFSGSGFLFVRPGAWDARDRLTGRRAPYDRQDTGFTFGGPIAKDRTHFFTNLEYRNEDDQAIVTATLDGGQFQGTFPIGSERLRILSKVDHRFSERHMITASFIYGDETGRSGDRQQHRRRESAGQLQRRPYDSRQLYAADFGSHCQRTEAGVFEGELQLGEAGHEADLHGRRSHLSGAGHDPRLLSADGARLGAADGRQPDADARPSYHQGGRQRQQRDARRRPVPEPAGHLHVRARGALSVQSQQPGVVPHAVPARASSARAAAANCSWTNGISRCSRRTTGSRFLTSRSTSASAIRSRRRCRITTTSRRASGSRGIRPATRSRSCAAASASSTARSSARWTRSRATTTSTASAR